MRVTQRTMYSTYINNMNTTLSAYMESNMQGASQKKINRPSDDPAGMALVLNTRNDINKSTQFEKNADTAQGWVDLAQTILGSNVSALISEIKVLAEQMSTGTYDDAQRATAGKELREKFGELLSLSNTQFGDKSLFAGHKYNENAFEESVAVTSRDEAFEDEDFQVEGKVKYTQLVEFTSGGELDGTVPITYRWSGDGGKTWLPAEGDADLEYTPGVAPNNTIDLDGVTLTMPATGTITPYIAGDKDAEPDPIPSSGTSLMVRPTAVYMGDDNDRPPETMIMGGPVGLESSATGTFDKDVLVRFDADANLNTTGEKVLYSYSEDNGATWIQAETETTGGKKLRLTIPGGYVDVDTLTTPVSNIVGTNTQILVHPNRADLGYEIMDNTYITVNAVGKEFFGGVVGDPPKAIEGVDGNIFETLGELIANCETNNQAGIQEGLDKLKTCQEEILAEAAHMGALDNRISLAQDVLSFEKLNKFERLSYTEDVDLTELLTRMAQQQLAYNTVLQSTSSIMQLSLAKFL